MAEGCIYIYTGDGRGKSPAAIGRAVQAAVEGKSRYYSVPEGKGTGRFGFPAQDGTGDQIVPLRKIGQQFCGIAGGEEAGGDPEYP